MTITRYILLTVVAFAPLPACGQVFTSSPPGMIDGPGNRFTSRSNSGEFADPGYSDRSGVNAQTDAEVLLMQATAAGPQLPSEVLPQQSLPPGPISGPARHYNTSPIWQTSTKGGYFGIMGAIAQPGVYFSAERRITLGELLKLAGGATPTASGGVRIVRQGRGGLQTFLTPDSKHEIMNGDVVLLESQRPQTKTGLRDYRTQPSTGDTAAASNAAAPAPKGPQLSYLAFVNLSPQPIVVPVPSDQATLVAVMKWLHQDENSPPYVRVIAPNPVLRQNSSLPVDQQVLENGSVLVFDPSTVKSERLPPFPPVIGQIPAPEAAPIVVRPGSVAQPAVKNDAVRIPAPETRQQRPSPAAKPMRAPAPPTTQRDPRTGEIQQFGQTRPAIAAPDTIHEAPYQGVPHSGGPLLMMPQPNRPQNSQATVPDPKSRQSLPPKRLQSQRADEATPAHYVGQTISWQSRPPVRANEGQPEVEDDQGVVQAHGEEGRPDDEFVGPALELPRPVPKLVEPDPIVATQPAAEPTAAAAPKPVPSTFSMQIVWFSLGSMALLMAVLWFVSRWDGPRPVRAALTAGHTSRFRAPAPSNHGTGTPQPALRILKPIGKTVAEAPFPMPPITPTAVPEPARVKPAAPAPTPGPTRTISQEEQRLRAHFREARQAHAVATPEPIHSPAPPAPAVATPSSGFSREELRQLTGRVAGSAEKILAQVPTVKKPNPPSERIPATAGNLLDRVLRAQQKR